MEDVGAVLGEVEPLEIWGPRDVILELKAWHSLGRQYMLVVSPHNFGRMRYLSYFTGMGDSGRRITCLEWGNGSI
jgi:hypothetical protein